MKSKLLRSGFELGTLCPVSTTERPHLSLSVFFFFFFFFFCAYQYLCYDCNITGTIITFTAVILANKKQRLELPDYLLYFHCYINAISLTSASSLYETNVVLFISPSFHLIHFILFFLFAAKGEFPQLNANLTHLDLNRIHAKGFAFLKNIISV